MSILSAFAYPWRGALVGILLANLGACTQCAECTQNPDTRAYREATAVRALVHREDSLASDYKTLTARGYACTDGKDQNLFCSKDFGWKDSCLYSVHVMRTQTNGRDDLDVRNLPLCH